MSHQFDLKVYYEDTDMGDNLLVCSSVILSTAARWVLEQTIKRDGIVLFKAEVTIVAIGVGGFPRRLFVEIRRILPL